MQQQLPKVPRFTKIPTLQDIKYVHTLIAPWIHNTPVLSSQTIDDQNECKIFFKCENFQKLGSFKIRGALSRVLSLSDEQRKKDVFTSSSGNFAQALSFSGVLAGLKPIIAVPSIASQVKKDGVQRLGGILYDCGATLETRVQAEKDIQEKEGRIYLSSHADYNVIAGQGTSVKQLLESYPDLECIIAPVSGGGLMSGCCLAGHYINPKIKMYAAQPELADDCYQSIKNDKLTPHNGSSTIAEGLRVNITPLTFQILRQHLQEVLVVSEEEIIQAMKLIFIRLKIVVETSSAVALAALLRNKEKFKGKKVGIVLSGGNVDLAKLPFK